MTESQIVLYEEGELTRGATVSKMETVQTEGGRQVVRNKDFYNLDAIIAVGYKVNSKRATQFRIWATKVLKEHIIVDHFRAKVQRALRMAT